MTDSDRGERLGLTRGILKRDARGRVRTTAEQREAILGEFELSGLSGPQFARVAGINYQTLATWRQQQRKSRTGSRLQLPCKAPDAAFHFAEVMVQAQATSAELRPPGTLALRVQLRDGVQLEIRDAGEVALAVQLIKALQTVC